MLAVLGDGEDAMWKTLRTAVRLADAERARLTLVKTCPAGRAYVWCAPFAVGGAYLPPPVASPHEAERILARVAQLVPASTPVTMLVLGIDTQASLRKLLRSGDYGAVVAEPGLLSHCWRLRRQLRRDQVETIFVTPGCETRDAGTIAVHSASSRVTDDGALDAEEVSLGGGGRYLGLRPGFARRLAGTGAGR